MKDIFTAVMCILVGLLALPAYSAEELLVRQELQVYEEAQSNSAILTTLERGERVPISSQEYGKFRKVLVDSGGKRRVGYVLSSALEGSRIREKKEGGSSRDRTIPYHRRMGIGVPVTMSYLSQSGWKFSSGDGSATEISAMSGTAIYFGFSFDIPMDLRWSLRAELNLRKSNMTGTTKPVGGGDKQVERTITFVSFGATAKFYLEADGNFWLGGGFEFAKANSVTLIYANSEKVPVSETDFPTYFIIKAGLGQDFKLFDDIYLTPELRVVTAINTSPMVMGGELAMTFAYAF